MKWTDIINAEIQKPYYRDLYNFVDNEYKTQTVYPPRDLILNAFNLTPYDNVKCVILGQDPYHGPNQAMGLAFSVQKGITIPQSLKNIYKELQMELGCTIPTHGDLTEWAQQGVLLLNSVLTVRNGEAASHQKHGWETYTDAILTAINQKTEPVVILLWGNYAKAKRHLLTNPNHLVLESSHPSPYSANYGFFGCDHFKRCNQYLATNGIEPINWQIH